MPTHAYTNLYLFPLLLGLENAELWVPHLLEQNPVTATSAAVKTMLTAFFDAELEASLTSWLFVNDFPIEYAGSEVCLASERDSAVGLFDLVW